ncbi:nucleotidyltransferase domain-containing protein [Candidatus Woesearchaeota archaeon]|nr:nucleotidyltransferase domain-containing protein [Candidatus Woesearchaeota archaeon]
MIKQAIKVGNSAGILLPRKYLGSLIEVNIKTPSIQDIKKQILEKTGPYLEEINGIYLTGSYARNEEKSDSDVDVVIISDNKILLKMENYHLICLEYNQLLKEMKESIIEYYPMLLEAKPIINKAVLKSLLAIPLTKNNLKYHLESCKSALKVIKKALETEEKDLIVNDAVIYSLILRLRSIYLVDAILNKKIGSIKGFIEYSKSIDSIEKLYDIYRKLKNDKKVKIDFDVNDIEQCYKFVYEKLIDQEKRINELKEKKKTA